MPGRPDFSAAGSQGSGQVIATNSRPEVQDVMATTTGSVAAGNTEITEVYAPTGSVYNFLSAYFFVSPDATATTGTHQIKARPLDRFLSLQGRSTFDTAIQFKSGWQSANDLQRPSTDAAAVHALSNLRATENAALSMRYINNTDAAQDNDRNMIFVVEEVSY